jgi:hypothetical protein
MYYYVSIRPICHTSPLLTHNPSEIGVSASKQVDQNDASFLMCHPANGWLVAELDAIIFSWSTGWSKLVTQQSYFPTFLSPQFYDKDLFMSGMASQLELYFHPGKHGRTSSSAVSSPGEKLVLTAFSIQANLVWLPLKQGWWLLRSRTDCLVSHHLDPSEISMVSSFLSSSCPCWWNLLNVCDIIVNYSCHHFGVRAIKMSTGLLRSLRLACLVCVCPVMSRSEPWYYKDSDSVMSGNEKCPSMITFIGCSNVRYRLLTCQGEYSQ